MRPTRVLIVDDHPDSRDMLAEYLAFRGFGVSTAADGEEAIEVAKAAIPDVILMDLRLPGVDGREATRRLKGDPTTHRITVIAVTTQVLPTDADAARQAGCDGVIAKPYDLIVLADSLGRLKELGAAALNVPGLWPTRSAGRGQMKPA